MVTAARRGEMVLLAASALAALLLGEGAARLMARGQHGTGYAPARTDGRDRRPINALGYRDLERAVPKPAGVRRVVCIGDSFTWGVSVLFDDAWPQRVERTLSRERGERWEAVNLAEPGLNSEQEASRLDSEGFAYGPDVVVVGYVLNDSEDSSAAEARRASEWVAERRRAPSVSLLDRSALARLVRDRLWATVENRRRVEDFRSMYAEDYSGWAAARRALKAMGGMCRERGVPLVVAIFPLFGNPLDDGYPFADIHAKVTQAAAEAGAKVVDLLPRYRGLDWKLLVVNGADDEHPNEIAHRIAAQAIVRAVDDVVPRATAPAPLGAGSPVAARRP
ncbi:MAG TPA: SGNH/GDSL hydrolase family protein [Vicinamibacteria bacterium]|nr:SGNH/GDSL hydrolase family protein [Vicinamibacteria bacterium]